MVVDNENHVIGMISLSDIISFLALRPISLERKDVKNTTHISKMFDPMDSRLQPPDRKDLSLSEEDELEEENEEENNWILGTDCNKVLTRPLTDNKRLTTKYWIKNSIFDLPQRCV